MAVLVALVAFTAIRIARTRPARSGPAASTGRTPGPPGSLLAMIFGVIATLLLYRGAQVNTGDFPYGKSWWPFASRAIGAAFSGFSHSANMHIETTFILLQIAVIWGFFVFVLRLQAPAHLRVGAQRALLPAPQSAGPARHAPRISTRRR